MRMTRVRVRLGPLGCVGGDLSAAGGRSAGNSSSGRETVAYASPGDVTDVEGDDVAAG